jgi:hypothetical protein
MVQISTVCPLDLNSKDQLLLIACEAKHLMGDYDDLVLLEKLASLRDAALELHDHWVARNAPKPLVAQAEVKPTRRKKTKRDSLDA